MLRDLTRNRVYFAGICSLIVTVGVARFAYTPLLPIMQEDTGLSETSGGWLATTNYMGYLFGVFIAACLNNLKTKYYLHQIYLILSVASCAGMVFTTSLLDWSFLRFIAGISASGSMIIASGLILKWLVQNRFQAELGIHFAGIGISIIVITLLIEGMISLAADWKQQWLALSALASLLAIPAALWIPKPSSDQQTTNPSIDNPPPKRFTRLILLAYFCAGYGYVVSATFIVDIIEGMQSLQGLGNLAFVLVGISAMPAVIIWDRVARNIGYLKALLLAYSLKILGILLLTLDQSLPAVIISALLFGGTFIAIVSLVLTMAGNFYPSNPAKFMGKMTLSYGTAQILAPILTGYLADLLGNYNLGLYLTSVVMVIGLMLIFCLLKIETGAINTSNKGTSSAPPLPPRFSQGKLNN